MTQTRHKLSGHGKKFSPWRSQSGMTMVELLVALAIGLIIVLAATAALLTSRSGAAAVDSASQLRDSSRFATDLIQRLADQAGFEDLAYVTQPYRDTAASYKLANADEIATLRPNVYGYNNRQPSLTDPLNSSTAWTGTSVAAGSDVLILQYQAVRNDPDAGSVTSASDQSMILCDGTAPTDSSAKRSDRLLSVLYVAVGTNGEPSLTCLTKNDSTGVFYTAPLLSGVERFQVLYGVDNVTPGAAPTGNATSIPNRYLHADQLTVAGNEAATNANWRRVRSIRVGLVLRGPVGSALNSDSQTLLAFGSPDFSSTADTGARYTVTDSRLRQVVTFTMQLRNCQNQGYQPKSSTTPCDVVMPS